KAIAEKLGVKFEPVIVTSANCIQFLQAGRIDVIIATLADSPERRRAVDMIEPHYFSNGTNTITPQSKHYTKWTQLTGQTVCGQQGSTFNKWAEQKYGIKTMTFPTIDEGLAAMRGGNCAGFLNNDKVILMALRNPVWKDYEMTLPSGLP